MHCIAFHFILFHGILNIFRSSYQILCYASSVMIRNWSEVNTIGNEVNTFFFPADNVHKCIAEHITSNSHLEWIFSNFASTNENFMNKFTKTNEKNAKFLLYFIKILFRVEYAIFQLELSAFWIFYSVKIIKWHSFLDPLKCVDYWYAYI